MRKKSFQVVLFSAAGVIATFIVLVAINFIAAHFKERIDLTQEKAYTLSAGTRAILAKLDTPVQIRFYVSQRATDMPVSLKTYAQQVDDLLGEYRQASRGLIEIQKLDPEPDSEAEDSARLNGVQGEQLPNGERIYLGLSVTMLDQKQAIPFLAPDRERLLEYDISRAIARVSATKKPTIGIMSSLPIMGMPNPMMQMGQRGEEPWALVTELKRDFDVKEVPITADQIPDNVQVLVVIHPRGITDGTQFAIDPTTRASTKEEKAEEKTKLDKEFQIEREALEKKLAKEQGFEGRPFLIAKFSVEQLEKNPADLLVPKPTPTPTLTPTATPSPTAKKIRR